MPLADAFIKNNLQCIQAIHFFKSDLLSFIRSLIYWLLDWAFVVIFNPYIFTLPLSKVK